MNKTGMLLLFFFFMSDADTVIFDFTEEADLSSWRILDDVVMGGRSAGDFYLNKEGNAVFSGTISLDNYGGFSSVRHQFKTKDISEFTKVEIRLKGDGKKYQFRIKNSRRDYYSYITSFQTAKEWETITIYMADMYPAFRGRVLDMENLKPNKIQEIAFLIGNKKVEAFSLEIDKISLK
jgi:hypothetical protein